MSLIGTPSGARSPTSAIRKDTVVQNPIGLIGMAGGGYSLTCEIRKDIRLQKLLGVTRDQGAIFILWGQPSTPPAGDPRADFDHIESRAGVVAGLVPATTCF